MYQQVPFGTVLSSLADHESISALHRSRYNHITAASLNHRGEFSSTFVRNLHWQTSNKNHRTYSCSYKQSTLQAQSSVVCVCVCVCASYLARCSHHSIYSTLCVSKLLCRVQSTAAELQDVTHTWGSNHSLPLQRCQRS